MSYELIRERLKEIMKEKSLKKGRFVLSSGKMSDYYIDAKLSTMDGEGAYLISCIFLDELRNISFDSVGGMTLGADPMVGSLLVQGMKEGIAFRGFIVRKEAKAHGMERLIEGNLKPSDRVVIIEDVITTGSTTFKAIRAVEEEGCKVVKVLSVVDRLEGGREALEEKGYPVFSIFTKDDLIA